MKYTLFLSVIMVTILFVSCKKDATDLHSETHEYIDKAKSFLKDVKSDAVSEYYISGQFDGHNIYCTSTFTGTMPYHDTAYNVFYVNNTIGLDRIHLIRENKDMSFMIAIHFDQAKIFTRQLPYVLPRANPDNCEGVQIELINMKKLGTTVQGSPIDDYSFRGHTYNSIKVQVTSFENNIIEGTFEGTLTTETGSKLIAKNGQFRLKIVIIDFGKGSSTYNSGIWQ